MFLIIGIRLKVGEIRTVQINLNYLPEIFFMIFLAISFHYIEEEDKYPHSIYPISPKRFSHQLDELAKFFTFISQEDLIEAIDGRKKLPKRSCMITFDDGLLCQYNNALPILNKKGIPALFLVSSFPYSEKKVCLVHKIHWLRAQISPNDFFAVINKKVKKIFNKTINNFFSDDMNRDAKIKYRYDNIETARLKFLLSDILDTQQKKEIIDGVFKEVVNNETGFVKNFYFSKQQTRKLFALGYLGIHSHKHSSLTTIPPVQAEEDIYTNKKIIEDIVKGEMKAIAYPYGNANSDIINICKRLGLKFGFTAEKDLNITLKEPLIFSRADTNDAPGGKHPLFKIINNKVKITGNFAYRRKLFN